VKWILTMIIVLMLPGCTVNLSTANPTAAPACPSSPDRVNNGLVLMAQSVPTTQWVPCIRATPVGWTFTALNAHAGGAQFGMASDREGDRALTVVLEKSCNIAGATQIPSEQSGMNRFERVTRVNRGYGGERYYVFSGGCVTYRFDLHGKSRAEAVTSVSQSLGFVSRDALRRYVHDSSDGRLELDPTPAAGT
jgi:hypothetical protein